jgi:hypothetical protein
VKSKQAVIVSKILQPLNTFQRIILVLSPNAQLEIGFARAISKINNILKQLGGNVIVHGTQNTLDGFSLITQDKKKSIYKYKPCDSFEDFEPMETIKTDDLFVFLNARPQTISYDYHVDEMAKKINKNNEFTSFIVFYPDISKALQDGRMSDITTTGIPRQYVKMKQFTGRITGIFKKEETGGEI